MVEHLWWHRQERLVEGAHERHRPFGEPGVLSEQSLVIDEGEGMLLGERAGLIGYELRALAAIENHFGLAELLHVVGEALHTKRLWRHETVAARLVAAFDAVDVEIDDLAVEQAEDRVQRTHPAKPCRTPSASISARRS